MDENRSKALAAALAQIEKQFGKGSIMRMGDGNVADDIQAVSTGSLGLDVALGIGGLPRGRVVEIYGPESSGKTTLTLSVIAQMQKLGGTAAFIDAEHALDPVYAQKLGVNVGELLISQPDTGEQALEIADIETIAAAAHAAGAYVVVDNTFATPLLQRPLELGADIVVHSVTKYLAGHSDVLMGAVVTRDEQLHSVLKGRRDLVGAVPGTLEAYLALRGLRTLHLRVERAQANARDLAERLAAHPAVEQVRYPGFGGIVSIELAAGAAAADRLTRSTRLWVHATSLGGVESSFERRRRWKSEPVTIPDALVRLSVGIEDVEDLWDDLRQALDAL